MFGCDFSPPRLSGLLGTVFFCVLFAAASIAVAQVPPGNAGSCAAISTSPGTVLSIPITTSNTAVYGTPSQRVRVEFNAAGVKW